MILSRLHTIPLVGEVGVKKGKHLRGYRLAHSIFRIGKRKCRRDGFIPFGQKSLLLGKERSNRGKGIDPSRGNQIRQLNRRLIIGLQSLLSMCIATGLVSMKFVVGKAHLGFEILQVPVKIASESSRHVATVKLLETTIAGEIGVFRDAKETYVSPA
jgi:hypothetical protein